METFISPQKVCVLHPEIIIQRNLSIIAGALNTEVDHGVGEGPAHVELQGQIVHTLGVILVVVLLGADPARHQVVLHRVGQGEVVVPATLAVKYFFVTS